MGKEKAKGASKHVKEEPPVEVKPGRKAKGHRQRGAGTIITAPPPVTTDDGITLAPHMRLPSVLLQEYCQREKRPKPLYQLCDGSGSSKSNSPRFRFRVCLADSKNSRNDLSFAPNQSSDSEKMAKDYAALLALSHFQPTIPLERKLPEPYCTTWKDLVATSSSSRANQPGSSKPRTVPNSSISVGAPNPGVIYKTSDATEGAGTIFTRKRSDASPVSEAVTPAAVAMASGAVSHQASTTPPDSLAKTAGKKNAAIPSCVDADISGAAGQGREGTRGPPEALLGLQSVTRHMSMAEKEKVALQRKAQAVVDKSYAEVCEGGGWMDGYIMSFLLEVHFLRFA